MGSAAAVLAARVWRLDPSGQVLTADLQRSVVAVAELGLVAVLELVAELWLAVQEVAAGPGVVVVAVPLLPAVDSTAEKAEVVVGIMTA